MANDQTTATRTTSLSLADLVGHDYVHAVCAAQSYLTGRPAEELAARATQRVELFPESFARRVDELADLVGTQVVDPVVQSAVGAPTASFAEAEKRNVAPINAFGCTRIGEDGRVYLTSKSEHYHASLGHGFPGYRIVDTARELGITNVTHNNTRGHITRLLEQELVRTANGIAKDRPADLTALIAAPEPHVVNRVINLETGSLAAEAAVKMMLARFYRQDGTVNAPVYADRVPVFLVMGDFDGGLAGNYHGTTVLTQILRGMWPELAQRLRQHDLYRVVPVGINDPDSFRHAVETYERAPYKVAGFLHEIVLMNYGGILLEQSFLRQAYSLCHEHDIPVLVDEIQSCAWSPQLFMYREYGLSPDFVAVGKGFPGGNTPASRILVSAALDSLNQFGALVTNGQEELSSLYYLVTMAFVEAYQDHLMQVGEYYSRRLQDLARRHDRVVAKVEGIRHLSAVFFHTEEQVKRFVRLLTEGCIDISAQTYKPKCPPAALTKLPIVTTQRMVDVLVDRMDAALAKL